MSKQIINVTDIIAYLYCPRKVYLKLVKGIKEPANKQMILGFLKHKIFDLFNKNESSIVSNIKENLNKQEIFEIYNNYLKAIIKETSRNYENMTKSFKIETFSLENQTLEFLKRDLLIRAEAVKNTLNLGFLGKELWRNLTPKYLTEFEIISGDLGLKGRIDRIKFEEKIMPYEIKTRDTIYDTDKLQLAAYSLLLQEEFGKEINKGIIETKNKQEEIDITPDIKSKVLQLAEEIRNLREKQEPQFRNNFNKCRNCMIKKQCFGEE